jgi:formate hydrogenlyase transcriptional activator
VKSACFLPLVARERLLGTLNVGRFPERAFTQDDVDFLRQVASQVALAADNALDYYQVAESRQRLAEERVYLNEEIRSGLYLSTLSLLVIKARWIAAWRSRQKRAGG